MPRILRVRCRSPNIAMKSLCFNVSMISRSRLTVKRFFDYCQTAETSSTLSPSVKANACLSELNKN